MKDRFVNEMILERYGKHLREEEYAEGTREKYERDVRQFGEWANGRCVSKEVVGKWKEKLQSAGYKAESINGKLASVNGFLRFCGWEDCRVKELRIQRRVFRSKEKELTRREYQQLIGTAERKGKQRLLLMMETICSTGVRVSEVKYISVEAARMGRAEIHLKGKIRTILMPGKLCRKLLKYAKKQKIASGEIFVTRSGKGISRRQIWAEMKRLCGAAGVMPTKVFPHNLRHLFARTFYGAYKDIVKLADILGHSSVETTRIYLISTGEEHTQKLERLMLLM